MPGAPDQAPAWAARDVRIVTLVAATLALGIPLDATALPWAQPAVSAWSWAALVWVAARSTPRHRLELAACVILATAGELFLKDVWGLYDYRLGNLPLFIPAGHALVFAAAARMSRAAPGWLPSAVVVVFGAVVGYGAWQGYDTFGLVWFAAFAGYARFSANPRLCATLFVFAFAIEAWGTALGGWRYHTVEPWFGLTTTNPPVWIGAIYCTLESLVRLAVAWTGPMARLLPDGSAGPRSGPAPYLSQGVARPSRAVDSPCGAASARTTLMVDSGRRWRPMKGMNHERAAHEA